MSLKTNSRHVSNLVRMDFLTMQLFKHILHRETSNCETDVGDNRGTPTIVDSKESVPYQQWLIWKVNLGSPLGSRSRVVSTSPYTRVLLILAAKIYKESRTLWLPMGSPFQQLFRVPLLLPQGWRTGIICVMTCCYCDFNIAL